MIKHRIIFYLSKIFLYKHLNEEATVSNNIEVFFHGIAAMFFLRKENFEDNYFLFIKN